MLKRSKPSSTVWNSNHSRQGRRTTETATMTPEQFAYWLQGFTELTKDMPVPSPAQWQAIKDHLTTVFVKVTPPMPLRTLGPIIASPALHPIEDRVAEWYRQNPTQLLATC